MTKYNKKQLCSSSFCIPFFFFHANESKVYGYVSSSCQVSLDSGIWCADDTHEKTSSQCSYVWLLLAKKVAIEFTSKSWLRRRQMDILIESSLHVERAEFPSPNVHHFKLCVLSFSEHTQCAAAIDSMHLLADFLRAEIPILLAAHFALGCTLSIFKHPFKLKSSFDTHL